MTHPANHDVKPSVTPVVLCGGAGTRMWPLSRGNFPKQFLNLFGNQSLLQDTVERVESIPNMQSAMLVCNHEHRFVVGDQLSGLESRPRRIIVEPASRNTAPAICAAALLLQREGPDALMLVLPADHIIKNVEAFSIAVATAALAATKGKIVTFGITPTSPHTGYGYIECGDEIDGLSDTRSVKAFVEKPNLQEAERLVSTKLHHWNGGIFLFQAAKFLEELSLLEPELFRAVGRSIDLGKGDADFFRLDPEAFLSAPNRSIDYAVMEKTVDAAMVVADGLGWSDIGSWSSLADESPQDSQGNSARGDVISMDCERTFVRADHRLVAVLGLKDVIVVETADAVLVVNRNSTQDVKRLVDALNQDGRTESMFHRRVNRPWGSYEGIDLGERFQVKRIIVRPGASLSLQMHYHRAEHWIVVKGTARVTNGSQTQLLGENQSTYIPLGTVHRLENPGRVPLELIEVQSGTYLGEDDIVRIEDHYGRIE